MHEILHFNADNVPTLELINAFPTSARCVCREWNVIFGYMQRCARIRWEKADMERRKSVEISHLLYFKNSERVETSLPFTSRSEHLIALSDILGLKATLYVSKNAPLKRVGAPPYADHALASKRYKYFAYIAEYPQCVHKWTVFRVPWRSIPKHLLRCQPCEQSIVQYHEYHLIMLMGKCHTYIDALFCSKCFATRCIHVDSPLDIELKEAPRPEWYYSDEPCASLYENYYTQQLYIRFEK